MAQVALMPNYKSREQTAREKRAVTEQREAHTLLRVQKRFWIVAIPHTTKTALY